MKDEKPSGGPTSSGKGWARRQTDRSNWEAGWRRFCKTYGHKYINNLCIYCGKVNDGRTKG